MQPIAEKPAYTSVATLLMVMHEKGLATRKEEGRAFRYTPALSQAEMRSAFVANVLDSVFAGDLDEFKAAVKASKSGKKE